MKYIFEVENEITDCVGCPCYQWNNDWFDGFQQCGVLEKSVEGREIPTWCPLKKVEE